MTLSREESQAIGLEYRDRFESVDAFVRSVQRWQEKGGEDTAYGLRKWLERDLNRDRAAAGALSVVSREPLPLPGGDGLSDCIHCGGLGVIKFEVEPGNPNFGQALSCPACAGGQRRCGCPGCSSSSSNVDISTGEVDIYDHRRCVDASGHDFLHPEACPRCEDAGVSVNELGLPPGVNRAAILAHAMDRRKGA